jgi:hypothetical protein
VEVGTAKFPNTSGDIGLLLEHPVPLNIRMRSAAKLGRRRALLRLSVSFVVCIRGLIINTRLAVHEAVHG